MRDIDDKFFYLENNRVFYLLLTGLSDTEIANLYYFRHKNKFIYEVKKLLRYLRLRTRQDLIVFAVVNGLVNLDNLNRYKKSAS